MDHGTGPMVPHPETGKYRRTRLLTMTLGHSRKAVWLLCFKSSPQMVRAARGGPPATRRNAAHGRARQPEGGVLAADIFDPELPPRTVTCLRTGEVFPVEERSPTASPQLPRR